MYALETSVKVAMLKYMVRTQRHKKNIKLLFSYFYLAFLLIPKVYFKSNVIDTTRRRQKVTTEINSEIFFDVGC